MSSDCSRTSDPKILIGLVSQAALLLLISSFRKETITGTAPHLHIYEISENGIISELIVAGFADGHTAFLVRATLARLQRKLSLPASDVAVITRAKDNEVNLQQIIDLGDKAEAQERFWRALANLHFAVADATDRVGLHPPARLAEIGIDTAFRRRVAEIVRPGTSALFVLVREPLTREGVHAVLRGFQGEIARTTLTGDDRDVWERAVLEQRRVD